MTREHIIESLKRIQDQSSNLVSDFDDGKYEEITTRLVNIRADGTVAKQDIETLLKGMGS